MSTKNIGLLAVLTLTSLFTAGCIVGIGDSRGHQPPSPTLGQELVDLQKAKDTGAISADEYAAAKKKLMAH